MAAGDWAGVGGASAAHDAAKNAGPSMVIDVNSTKSGLISSFISISIVPAKLN